MIKTIVKRDGAIEPFQASKINGWGEWATQKLGDLVDWSSAVMATVGSLPEQCSSKDLQHSLIRYCLNQNTWSYNRMAGRLYAATLHKDLYEKDAIPSIAEVQGKLVELGYMTPVASHYTDEELAVFESTIDHKRDFDYAHFQLHHIRYKYALRNHLTGFEIESPQFVFMRMAMALGTKRPKESRAKDVVYWYQFFSKNKINAPTPNYTNLGTKLNGYASCCLYAVNDTAASLAVGDHIAYTMTVMSAGIGGNIMTRSKGDPVRGGLFAHRGKLPYYRSLYGAIQANIKNGRNGACTTYYSAYDPEIKDLLALKNPMTPADKQIRGMDYNMMSNKFLGRKAARGEDIFTFNPYTAPDLSEAFYSADLGLFERLYNKYQADPNFKKNYIPARDIVIGVQNEAFEVGRAYLAFMDEINRHTSFKDPIHSSNLCVEVTEPTTPYEDMRDLYTDGAVGFIRFLDNHDNERRLGATYAVYDINTSTWKSAQDLKVGDIYAYTPDGPRTVVGKVIELKKEPEVALCSLAALVPTNIGDDEEYELVAYYALLMIDICIHMSDYPLPHVGYTAKQRISAGLGLMDLAHHMARKKLKYSSQEGKEEIHRVMERHSYFAIKASLKLGKELGNAPWMHRTKWVDGWLPIDTYNRNVDAVVPNAKLIYDWEELRGEIVANGGIRNSGLICHMPGESSSKASGGTNSLYPIRELFMMKTDNNATIYWAAPEGDTLGEWYESAWDIPTRDMIEVYAVVQKFTDQAISADYYRRIQGSEKITTDEMLGDFFHMLKMGNKSRYYLNTQTAKAVVLDQEESVSTIHRENTAAEATVEPVDIAKRPEPIAPEKPLASDSAMMVMSGLNGLTSNDLTLKAIPEPEFVYNNDDAEAGCAGGFCSL